MKVPAGNSGVEVVVLEEVVVVPVELVLVVPDVVVVPVELVVSEVVVVPVELVLVVPETLGYELPDEICP